MKHFIDSPYAMSEEFKEHLMGWVGGGKSEKLLMNKFPSRKYLFDFYFVFPQKRVRSICASSETNFWCFFAFDWRAGVEAKAYRRFIQFSSLSLGELFFFDQMVLNKYFLLKSCPNLFHFGVKGGDSAYIMRRSFPNHFSTQLTVTSNEKLSQRFAFCQGFLTARPSYFSGVESKKCWNIPRHSQQNKHKKWINCAFLLLRLESTQAEVKATKRRKRNSSFRDFALWDMKMISSFLLIWYFYWSFGFVLSSDGAHTFRNFIFSRNPNEIFYLFNSNFLVSQRAPLRTPQCGETSLRRTKNMQISICFCFEFLIPSRLEQPLLETTVELDELLFLFLICSNLFIAIGKNVVKV